MNTRRYMGVLAVLAVGPFAPDLAAAVGPEVGTIAAGLRVPVGTLWLVGPMLLGVAGAITLGWRRASSDAGQGLHED